MCAVVVFCVFLRKFVSANMNRVGNVRAVIFFLACFTVKSLSECKMPED